VVAADAPITQATARSGIPLPCAFRASTPQLAHKTETRDDKALDPHSFCELSYPIRVQLTRMG